MIAIQTVFFLAAVAFLVLSIIRFIASENKRLTNVLPSAIIFLLVAFVINPSFGQVPAGHRGVVLNFGKVTGKELGEGLYFVTPFVDTVELMNVQTHAEQWDCSGASKDLQDVVAQVTLNYHIDESDGGPSFVYKHLRRDYVQRVMVPAIKEAVKTSTAKFDAERLIIERPKVKAEIEDYLRTELARYRIKTDGVAITNFGFSENFSKAIEAKVTSQQLALKAQNDLQIVKAEAQQQIETAKAQAEAIRIQANAINAQGGRDYVHLQAINKWNGALPGWITGNSAMPFINVPSPR